MKACNLVTKRLPLPDSLNALLFESLEQRQPEDRHGRHDDGNAERLERVPATDELVDVFRDALGLTLAVGKLARDARNALGGAGKVNVTPNIAGEAERGAFVRLKPTPGA